MKHIVSVFIPLFDCSTGVASLLCQCVMLDPCPLFLYSGLCHCASKTPQMCNSLKGTRHSSVTGHGHVDQQILKK